jgi:hypothetical protein
MADEHAASDPEVPDKPDPTEGPEAVSKQVPAEEETKAEGSIVDAAAGHQADKPAVAGDPDLEPQPYSGPEPAADAG